MGAKKAQQRGAPPSLGLSIYIASYFTEMGDPIQMIKDRITQLRQDHENSEVEIYSLQQEKHSIQQVTNNIGVDALQLIFLTTHSFMLFQILPRIIHELMTKRDKIEEMQHEIKIYDRAIGEIETNYGHIILSPAFYAQRRS